MFNKELKLLVLIVGCVTLLSACGSKEEKKAKAREKSVVKAQKTFEKKHNKPAVDAEVVGIKLGMKESDVRKKLEKDGWKLQTDRKRVENVAGVDPIEFSEVLHYTRETQMEGEFVNETASAHFLAPVPKNEPQAYIIMFNRITSAQKPRNQNSIASAKQVTSEYSTSMLALAKKKYGKPHEVVENACTTRGGGPISSIPIYEANYYPDVRSYMRTGGMQIKIADGCRQQFAVRIEDSDYAKYLRNKFSEYAQKMQSKTSSSTNRKVDF